MDNNFQIRKVEELFHILSKFGKPNFFEDFDYQLQTNYGWIYNLPNRQVVFMPNNFKGLGIIFEDQSELDKIVKADKFPIENPENELYDSELERIKTINNQINYYHNHLNTILKFDFDEISREAAQAYLKKIIGRSIKQLTTDKDLVALIAVFGEIIRREINGKWVIEKWYGTYNPHFKPRILTVENKLIFIDDNVWSNIKWKVSAAEMIFDDIHGQVRIEERTKYHECIILKD